MPDPVIDAFQRHSGGTGPADLAEAIRMITATAAVQAGTTGAELLDALVLLHWARAELADLEPRLISAARAAGVSWQMLAPALGVASRQAAERRYLRLIPASTEQQGSTRDERVRAERDRRAGAKAVGRWANDNTTDLRQLAGQITALTDLEPGAEADVDRLLHALGDADAAGLPDLLAGALRHLDNHHDLAARIDDITARADQIRRDNGQRRAGN